MSCILEVTNCKSRCMAAKTIMGQAMQSEAKARRPEERQRAEDARLLNLLKQQQQQQEQQQPQKTHAEVSPHFITHQLKGYADMCVKEIIFTDILHSYP